MKKSLKRQSKRYPRSLMHDRELKGMGLIRARDGFILDNRNGFYDDCPDTINEYDSNVCVAVTRKLLHELICIADPGLLADIDSIQEIIDIRL